MFYRDLLESTCGENKNGGKKQNGGHMMTCGQKAKKVTGLLLLAAPMLRFAQVVGRHSYLKREYTEQDS